ncbi:MAG TPA: hypothetical protein VFH01_06785 [Pyrinomonadaceae bacterium]|nr:hypothetical protein [Pyrinomonadaceae bacterium]
MANGDGVCEIVRADISRAADDDIVITNRISPRRTWIDDSTGSQP